MNSKDTTFPAHKPMRQIVLDTETTGLRPEDGHRIVELAAIELNGREITQNRFHQLFNPEREVDEGAVAVHGLSWDRLQDEPKFAEFANQIAEFIRDAELIIHNAPFDVGFLNSEFERAGLPPVESICRRVTDTLVMAKKLNPGEKNNLSSLCKRYGIDESQPNTHGTMRDSELLAEVYLKMASLDNS